MKTNILIFACALISSVASAAEQLVPINQLGTTKYHDFAGGLYANGSNAPSTEQAEALRRQSDQVQPLDSQGKPDARGKIVVAGIGASVCRQIFESLEATPIANPSIVFVNAAVGGADVNKIAEPRYWSKVESALSARNVTAAQVQVVWYQSDDLRDQRDDFPGRPQRLKESFAEQMRIVKTHFPNARLCYHSARHTTAGMPADQGKAKHAEPRPYHVGWAVKWLIEDQSSGQSNLAFEGEHANAPLVAWANYFWTNVSVPRADGYTWSTEMNVSDGVHLTEAGQQRVAKELIDFWSTDRFAKTWFDIDSPTAMNTTYAIKPQRRAAQALKPGEPALLLHGKSKFAKLERVLGTNDKVRLVVTDAATKKVVLVVEDVFHQRTDLEEKLSKGEYLMRFYQANGEEIDFKLEVPHVVNIR